jgi:hypothetical protein
MDMSSFAQANRTFQLYTRYDVAIVICLICFAFLVSPAKADYKFVTGNPVAVQQKLEGDLQSGRLDRTNLDPNVVQAIQQNGPFSPSPQWLNQLGPLAQVCLLFGVKSDNQRTLALRTVHQNGCGDWLITMIALPETVRGISFKAKLTDPTQCGPPVFLPVPPPPGSSASFYIPPQLTCTPVGAIH